MISLLIFLPLLALIPVLSLPESRRHQLKYWVLATGIAQLAVLAFIGFENYMNFGGNIGTYAIEENLPWIQFKIGDFGSLVINYHLGIDGLSYALLCLSSLVNIVACAASFGQRKSLKGYYALFLLLNTAVTGVFCAVDLFLFYVFYEFMLLPLYFLVGIWGGPKKEYAAIKFFLFTFFGSLFILLAFIALFLSVQDPVLGGYSFDLLHMMNPENFREGSILSLQSASASVFGHSARLAAFVLLFVGFAIKVPIVPFHTWLPDAHVEAPTSVSIILAGIVLKVGAYGIIRFCYGIFPEGAIAFAPIIGALGAISIVYGALNALAQTDLKKLIAYSSISHMGFVLIGLASLTIEGMNGAVFQMISHGVLAALLFYLVSVIYRRTGDRSIANYSGLHSKMPRYTAAVSLCFFAALGLPGFSAFIGELLSIMGAFSSESVNQLLPRWITYFALFGLLIGAAYFLSTLQRMFFGDFKIADQLKDSSLHDLIPIEKRIIFPLLGITLILGLMPRVLFDLVEHYNASFVDYCLEQGNAHLSYINYLFGK